MFDYKTYKPTGCAAVDAVVACIYSYRQKQIAVKALHLKPQAYNQWEYYWKKVTSEPDAQFSFDGVNINLGSVLQMQSIRVELFENQA